MKEMAGGLFPGYPFKFNLKCVVFTALLAGGYWYLPPKNFVVLALLLWLPYIALAWYDYAYKCTPALGPTLVPFGQYVWLPFKPPSYKAEYARDTQLQEAYRRMDHLIGWTILIGLVVFVTMYRRKILRS
jgi:hypothetical protein